MDPLRRVTPAQKFALARELRFRATPAERFAWSLLRNRGVLGLKFRRQHVLHGFIVDFCCLAARIVLEVDGDAHDGEPRRSYDAARTAVLEAAGFQVLRIANRDVTRDKLERLLRSARTRTLTSFPLSRRERGPGGEDPEGRGGSGGDDPEGREARGNSSRRGARG